jgi:putative ABC transport system permease protein
MNAAVWRKTAADLRRRKVQTAVVTLVVLLSALASTLALSLLVESDRPFDRAFEAVAGPHLVVSFDSTLATEAQVDSTRTLPVVSAAGGPWRQLGIPIDASGGRVMRLNLVGRDRPGGAVDRLTMESGRWLQADGEVVLARGVADELGLQIGDAITPSREVGAPSLLQSLRVVGIATAIADPAEAWVLPAQVPLATTGKEHTTYLVAYRLHAAGTATQIASGENAIAHAVPRESVVESRNYLSEKLGADRTTAVMIPFLLAFSGFALLASALIVANLVGGAVIASYREIGVMKSVGFTPWQVMTVFAAQMVIPSLGGCLLGIAAGVLASQPFLADTAHAFGLPQTFAVAPEVDAWALATVLLVVATTAVLASLRAGHLSAAEAIASGSAPGAGRGFGLARAFARTPLPRTLSLGLGESLARPIRSAMTMIAIMIGVATVTFAIGLHNSLVLVAHGVTRDRQVQVDVFRIGAKGPGGTLTDQQAMALIAAQPGTARLVAERGELVSVPGAGEPVPLITYRGDSSWLGYPVIHGRWFHGPGEAVAPTAFFTRTHDHLGDSVTAHLNGSSMALTLVGEIFDQQGDDVLLRADMAALPGSPNANQYEVQLTPGTDANRWAGSVQSAGNGQIDVRTTGSRGIETAFLLIDSVLAGLALILTLIAASGVFNTVVLNTREKARDTAILKAIGMTPNQVTGMVLASVAAVGIIGALLGIPAGQVLHHRIIVLMGEIATQTAIPASFFAVFSWAILAGLWTAGILVALMGAMLPAQWAARSPVADVLQTE